MQIAFPDIDVDQTCVQPMRYAYSAAELDTAWVNLARIEVEVRETSAASH
jgi:hypothetical protein